MIMNETPSQKPPIPGTAEWRELFEAFEAFVREHPAPKNIDELSDEELNAIIHEVRRARSQVNKK